MILNMACKGPTPGDGALVVTPGIQPLQRQELGSLDVSRIMASPVATQPQSGSCSQQAVDVDVREVYFLVMHFLSQGPCSRAFLQLWNELLEHKLLPRRYHARYSRDGKPSGDENDDGMSLPLSYHDVATRYPTIGYNHLVDLLRQLLKNNMKPETDGDSVSRSVTAADGPTLLGAGAFSLLDSERNVEEEEVSRWNLRLRWPHWQADQGHGVMLREIGGGFARHHRSPSVRAASYVLAKPDVFFSRIKIIKKLRGHRNAVYCAIFDRNGQHVITGSDDRLVKIWSMETGLCLRSCRGHEGDITDLAVSSSNELVASASNDFSIRVWQLPNGFPLSVLRGHGGTVTAIAFSPRQGCEHHLLSSSDDGTCRIWDARDSTVNSRVYMPDPKDSQSAARGVAVQVPPAPPDNQILCCAFNADGSIFVTGSSDKLARVWNATKWNDEHTGRPNYELDSLQGHENDVNYVQFSGCAAPARPVSLDLTKEDHHAQPRLFKNTWSAQDSIVTCSRDGSAIIWNPRPRRHHAKAGRWVKAYHLRVPPPPMPPQPPRPGGPRQRLLPTPRGVNMIVWSLDNRFVLAAIMDCRICVWNAADGSLVHSLTGHDKQTYVLDVHPFNPRIAMSAGYDGRVFIWDIWDGHPIRVYETGDYNLVDGHFSPDGSSLVVSDEVGQIYLFATGEGNSQRDAKYDQFFLGDFRPLVRDTHGNVLDQESQLAPHVRNIQDLLCDAGMIPYAEPYQTIYQQRRLGALKLDWHPPSVFYQIGTLDDPPYAGPPEPPVPFHAPVVRSPDRRERRALALEGGNRWVEQPSEADEVMDWEQEAAGLTEDSGSDYSASEECEDDGDDKADTLDEAESDEEEDDDDDGDEVRGDITIRLRRSSRNKQKAEMVTFSSSGRKLKRKRYDDGGDTHGFGRRPLRRRKMKSSGRQSPSRRSSPRRSPTRRLSPFRRSPLARRASPSRRNQASSSRHGSRQRPEPSVRPKRQAARNALHLLSSIHDEEEEEAPPQGEIKASDSAERASGSGEHQRVLRSRNREEPEENANLASDHANRAEVSDRGELSRRPRSQRKLVVKLRSSVPKVDPEDSKFEMPEEPHEDTPDPDHPFDTGALSEDQAVNLESDMGSRRPLRKLLIRHPRPATGLKRLASVIESSEDNHEERRSRREPRIGRPDYSSDSDPNSVEDKPSKEEQNWQWKKGKAAKRARKGKEPATLSDDSGTSDGGSSSDIDENSKGRLTSGRLTRSQKYVVGVLKDVMHDLRDSAVGEKDGEPAMIQINNVAIGAEGSVFRHEGGERALLSNGQAHENGHVPENDLRLPSPQRRHHGVRRNEWGRPLNASLTHPGCGAPGPATGLGSDQEDVKVDAETVLSTERTLAGESSVHPDANGMLENMGPSKLASGSGRYCSAEDNFEGGSDVLKRSTSSQYSGDDGNEANGSVGKESNFFGDAVDHLESDHKVAAAEEEAGNDADADIRSDAGESPQKVGSDEGNSQSEHLDVNGTGRRSWGESGEQDTDEESLGEGRRRTRLQRRKPLGELQLYSRQESTSNRHDASLELSGKTRTRQLNSVLNEGGRETRSRAGKAAVTELPERNTRKRTKDIQSPWQNGVRTIRTRHGSYQDGPSRYPGRDLRRGSTSDPEGSVEYKTRVVVRLGESSSSRKQYTGNERRTSGRSRRDDSGREQVIDRSRADKISHFGAGRGTRIRNGSSDRKKTDVSWLLLTEVEAGTRYIPQFGDDVVYLRQGHQEYLDATHSEERGPWRSHKLPIRPVEFCRIVELDYHIVPESHQTCCRLTLRFTDFDSRLHGKTFKLTLPDLTDSPDFIVERTRYDAAMRRGWRVRDKCQIWWRAADGGGQWWDGRVVKIMPSSPKFTDSPWDLLHVLYKMESNDIQCHSPWELFDPGNHWHDSPRIDEESREALLNVIREVVKSCYVGSEDEYGLRRLSHDVEDPKYLNCVALPLDLETVKQRLEKDYYHSLEAFGHDVQLLVRNTQVHHGLDSEICRRMQKLSHLLLSAVTYEEQEDPPSSYENGEEDESDNDQSDDEDYDDYKV